MGCCADSSFCRCYRATRICCGPRRAWRGCAPCLHGPADSRLCVTALTIVNGVAASVLFFAVGVAIETSIEHASDPAIASAMVSVIGFFVGTAFFAK